MDAEQFAQFLSIQQAQQEQILKILNMTLTHTATRTEAGTSQADSSVTSANTTAQGQPNKVAILKAFNMDKFNPDNYRVSDYIDFFEAKCSIHAVDTNDSLKKDLLLNCMTPDLFRELKTALTPNFETSTYTDIRTKLLDLYRVKKTRYRALIEFWSCIRENDESIEHYTNRLKALSIDCGYDDKLLERQLRDRFATGLNHTELETDLKQKWPNLTEIINGQTTEVTFATLFSIAQSREQAENDTPSTNVKRISKKANHKADKQEATNYRSPRKIRSSQCLRCGKHDKHNLTNCPARKHICEECSTEGHYESCCIKTGRAYLIKGRPKVPGYKTQRVTNTTGSSSNTNDDSSDDSDIEDDLVCNVAPARNRDCKRIDVIINGKHCTMDWDPGSAYSIISTSLWRQIGAPTLTKAPKLKAYHNFKLKSEGLTDVTVEVEGKQKIVPVVVMKHADPMLFGLQWSETFGMEFPKPVYSIKNVTPTTLQQLIDRYKPLFDGKLGKVEDYLVNIHIKPGAVPVHLPARPIKFGIKKNIEKEIARLVADNIIHPVDPNVTPVEWATPTVNVVKPNGDIRICGDFRSTLNPVLIKHLHPVPLFDQLRQKLARGKIFSKIDLKDAYLQFEIAPESKKYLTLSTHLGYFRYNRMPFGISTAPSIFQHYLDELLRDIPNTAVYFDDVAIAGEDVKEHLRTLGVIFERLQKAGLKVNLQKCSFLQNQIEYLGHSIDKNGIRPTKQKLDAISKAATPTNAKELRSFLGLVNFYERFIPHLHGICADLHELTGNRQPWRWTEHENQIFEATKQCITLSKPLTAFDEDRSIFLACDASEKGVGAVLYHKNGNTEQPIAFASRKLRTAETKYSVIDREALAILFGIKKFDQYLRGTKFTLLTDHKPLIHILGSQRNLPKVANNRLVRWALIIGCYNYDICYQKGENNILADCLSRLPNSETQPSETECAVHRIESCLLGTRMTDLHLSEDLLKETTSQDVILSEVLKCIKTGWREIHFTSDVKHFFKKRNELSIENKIILWQGRVVIPEKLQRKVLAYLHRGQPGISAMKALARFYVWWPSIDEDVDQYVKRCCRCQQNRPHCPELPIYSWSIPEKVWERIHIDFAGPFEGTYWLVLSDALSKWIEIKPMKNITTSKLCTVLDDIFCTFGLPEIIVSDNGPQFTSSEFKQYCKNQGILHIRSSPYHPRTNGLAERLVRTFKSRFASGTEPQHQRLREFLFTYRITPHNTTGKSPAEVMFGRQINTLLSNIRPNKRRELQYKQVKVNIETSTNKPNYAPGSPVYHRTRLEKSWQPGIIAERRHRYSYTISTPHGDVIRRHADHIRPRLESLNNPPNYHEPSPSSPLTDMFRTPDATSSPGPSQISSATLNSTLMSPPHNSSTTPEGSSHTGNTSNRSLSPDPDPVSTSANPTTQHRSQRATRPPRRLIEEM
ncbi:uncharacterized protein K02A2.6-like [Cydia pomonella]|uniref:uncharacterized protein K02A2.6-like n=1 Tax=Cydia pomonella TaxID=82600 RepID=UPI002ADE526E|nr:uncharacterized protein K02A2.6-like [Cydia pomonella]